MINAGIEVIVIDMFDLSTGPENNQPEVHENP